MLFIFDPLDDIDDWDDEDYGKEPKTCNRCGKRNLLWEQAGGKWMLVEPDGEYHVCKPSTDDFEDLTK